VTDDKPKVPSATPQEGLESVPQVWKTGKVCLVSDRLLSKLLFSACTSWWRTTIQSIPWLQGMVPL